MSKEDIELGERYGIEVIIPKRDYFLVTNPMYQKHEDVTLALCRIVDKILGVPEIELILESEDGSLSSPV